MTLCEPTPEMIEACPFCGGKAQIFGKQWTGFPFVECQICTVKISGGSKREAIAAWNTRARPQQDEATRDRLLESFGRALGNDPICGGRVGSDTVKYLVDLALSAQQERSRDEGWRTIESAPRDGSRVLVWAEQYSAACAAEFNGFHGWCIHGTPLRHQPSKWQPLPAPPTE